MPKALEASEARRRPAGDAVDAHPEEQLVDEIGVDVAIEFVGRLALDAWSESLGVDQVVEGMRVQLPERRRPPSELVSLG